MAYSQDFEPYVSVAVAAEFVSLTRSELLRQVRLGNLPAHAIDPSKKKRTYKFRLSELSAAMSARTNQQPAGLAENNNHAEVIRTSPKFGRAAKRRENGNTQ